LVAFVAEMEVQCELCEQWIDGAGNRTKLRRQQTGFAHQIGIDRDVQHMRALPSAPGIKPWRQNPAVAGQQRHGFALVTAICRMVSRHGVKHNADRDPVKAEGAFAGAGFNQH
jgi:hypothetical protein